MAPQVGWFGTDDVETLASYLVSYRDRTAQMVKDHIGDARKLSPARARTFGMLSGEIDAFGLESPAWIFTEEQYRRGQVLQKRLDDFVGYARTVWSDAPSPDPGNRPTPPKPWQEQAQAVTAPLEGIAIAALAVLIWLEMRKGDRERRAA